MEQNLPITFGFGTSQEHCEPDKFGSVEELLEYVQSAWDNKDNSLFNDGCDYDGTIFVGKMEEFEPKDFAPSLDDIADDMTDSFYCEHPIDDNGDVQIDQYKEAEQLWNEFVNKYFELPCDYTCVWFGRYSLIERKWIEKLTDFEQYIK